ncbi:MAG: hypothetical protein HOO06_02350 [Bdellovibrionaceae bacterium]|nr:hypothetical protein [Pseudobdellovibrionaceae bacterium]
METVIEARSLTTQGKLKQSLKGVHFQTQTGQKVGFFFLDQENNEDLFRLFSGQAAPTAGELIVLGYPMGTKNGEVKELTAVIDSEENLEESFTVREYLNIFVGYYGLSVKNQRINILEALRIAEIEDKEDDLVFDLTHCERRQLLIARSLVVNAKVIYVKNITKYLEHRDILYIRKLFKKIKGVTVCIFTDDLDDVEDICDEAYFFKQGQIFISGNPKQLIKENMGKEVVEFTINKKEYAYFSQRIKDNYDFQYSDGVLKVYLNIGQDSMTLLSLILCDQVVIRRPNLQDVITKKFSIKLVDNKEQK